MVDPTPRADPAAPFPPELAGARSLPVSRFASIPQLTLLASTLGRLRKNRAAVVSFIFLLLLLIPTFFPAQIAPYDPIEISPDEILQPPSRTHWFGTDQYGRDILSRIIYGTQYSIQLGFIAVGIAVLLGLPLGLISGFYGVWLDNILMRVVDIMLAFPGILLALVFVAILGPGLNKAILAVGIAGIPAYTRLVRGSVLSVKQYAYVEAARVIGCSNLRILIRHVLPNVFAPVLVLATLGIATAIISGSTLSFLGLGAQPPTPEWGVMLSTGRDYMRGNWWISVFPGLAIMVTVLAINLLGDGLRDALDPRLKV